MPRFFTGQINDHTAVITGEDARHITKALRMTAGNTLIVCDGERTDYRGTILSVGEEVLVRVEDGTPSETEPDLALHLYQAIPKGEKMDFIIQKAVELGAAAVTPVLTSRCVARPDEKSMEKKLIRYNKIAAEAAKQCGRGILPAVCPMLSYRQALAEMAKNELSILCYECGGEPLQKLIIPSVKTIGLLIGSEGGFSPEETQEAKDQGISFATLGRRILRCETAPVAAIAILMSLTGNM